MTQKINLNSSPYYDDFDNQKDFYKVLYKPGFPVQSRELTTQQSILQNQVEKFGDHLFKDGSVVIPGGIGYDNQFSAVKLNNTNFNVDISVYIQNFLGKKIRGSQSGIEAIVKFIALPDNINVTDVTLYVTYLTAGSDFQFNSFTDGESLSADEPVVYGNTTISANTPFASLVSTNATANGSAAFISKGVFFVRGFFVNVSDQTLILDHYNNNSSYRVGLQINELIISAKDDGSLYDNAKGFTNFAAPGADRLKIELILTKKLISDKNDTDFIELMRVDEGKIKKIIIKSDYNKIRDWIAERTFEESGDYSVDPFRLRLFNSLNDNLGNGGLFFDNDTTDQGNTPSDDLMCLKVSAGQAYVRGYNVEQPGTTIVDVDKPRDVGIRSDVGIGYELGNVLRVNNVTQGSVNQGSVVQLFNNFDSSALGGGNIGSARVYSFNLEDSAYEGTNTTWELRLFDIQTNAKLFLNQTISNAELPKESFVKGKNSGASGFAANSGGGQNFIELSDTSGKFITGEQIQINGIDFPRTIKEVRARSTQDIKSVQIIDGGSKFKADVVCSRFRLPNNVREVLITDNGTKATAINGTFSGLRLGVILTYTKPGKDVPTFNFVSAVNGNEVDLVACEGVTGVRDGDLFTNAQGLPTNGTTVQMFGAGPLVTGTGRLYAPLDNSNVESINLSDSKLKITRRLVGQSVTNNQLNITKSQLGIDDTIFEVFDQERYSIFDNTNGSPITGLGNDTFRYNNGGDDVTFTNVGTSSVDVNVTLIKNKIRSKLKEYNRSQELTVNLSKNPQSGSNAAGNGGSISDGLIFDSRYGLRVQDEEISLNYPDVVKFLAVYESNDTNPPKLDQLVFPASVDVGTNSIVGENIIGIDSQIIARVVSKNSNTLRIVYLSSGKFNSGDLVRFDESNIETNIQSITVGSFKNLTNSFNLDKGQRDEFYDYSRLVRNKNVPEPSNQLLIVFDYYSVSSDDGDLFTVASYDQDRFSKDIPTIGESNIRATDTLDLRPRVSVYDPSTDTGSPFNFARRNIGGSITRFLTPNESSTVDYNFYLPRIDKVYINKFSDFVYEKGVSAIDPKPPSKTGELMELATITLPPYLYATQDATILLADNRRFTMRDIGDIEDRVKNLEEVTTLSLLETSAQTLQVVDDEGRNRFKTGFFVDAFKNYNFINRNLSSIQINPDAQELIPFRTRDTIASQILPSASVDVSKLDFNTDFDLFDPNIKKTGDFITLNYEEVEWISQPFATRSGDIDDTLNVNPYELPVFKGAIELDPRVDTWTRTVQLPDQTIQQTGTNSVQDISLNANIGNQSINLGGRTGGGNDGNVTTISSSDTISFNASTSDSATFSNTDTTIQNNLVSTSNDDFMRSRNIQFVSSGFANFLQLYLFVDGQQIFDIIPKLVEIVKEPNGTEVGSNGTFKVGETVQAYDSSNNLIMEFRTCQPNHKSGSFSSPSETYLRNPYTFETGLVEIPSAYTPSIQVLNIDTKSLSEEAQGDFFGYLTKNAKLIGTESGAEAYVKDLRLITDDFGDLIGSCFIRDPHAQPAPVVKIQTGSKNFKLTSSPTNEKVAPAEKFGVIAAETRYDAFGTIQEWQDTVTITTNTNTLNVNGTFTGSVSATAVTSVITEVVEFEDPLAQTFVVGGNVSAPSAVGANKDLNGVFITSVEVFFATVDLDTNSPIRCEIRTVTGDARPSRQVIGRSRTLRPKGTDENGNEVTLIQSDPDNASVGTKFTFPEPIYLSPGNSYAFVLLAPQSVAYTVWTGRHGGTAVNASTITGADSGASIQYNTQYGAGAIFKSQNGALWTEDQSQDMTFKLYKARFTSQTGSAYFTNPKLSDSNGYVPKLLDNPIETLPQTGTIGITPVTNATTAAKLVAGRTISASYPTSTAVIVGSGASVSQLDTTPVIGGSNYVTDSDVETFAITGKGTGLKVSITGVTNAGVITSVSANPFTGAIGSGYQVGDIVGIVTTSVGTNGGTGRGAQLSIASVSDINTLFLTNIQAESGSYGPNAGIGITLVNDNGTITAVPGQITSRSFDSGANAGNVMKVNHFNHGMHSNSNKVSLKNIESDVLSTTLSDTLGRTITGQISVASTIQFANFEGIPVNNTNIGYVKIGNEVIGYSAVTSGNGDAGTLTIAAGGREIEGLATNHEVGSVVRKHELCGVSIRRLEVKRNVLGSPKATLDDYHISFERDGSDGQGGVVGKDRSSDATGLPQLSFSKQSPVGGSNVRGTQNILYSALVPRYDVLTPVGIEGTVTSIEASIRTVSGTSVDGNEVSFQDQGFQNVQLNRYNSLDKVNLVASKINEDQYLTNIPSNKSFTTIMNFISNDENLSPIIRLSSGSETEFISHRLNRPIDLDNYDIDNRVDSILNDPHAASYVSNTVRLKKPASSLKVLLTAFRPESSDFRVLYSLIKSDSSGINQAFELFPGFKNFTRDDADGFLVNDESKNDGRPDLFVTPSQNNEFKEYQFTADGLSEFIGYTIKIVMSGTDQSRPPRIKDLRTIAIK